MTISPRSRLLRMCPLAMLVFLAMSTMYARAAQPVNRLSRSLSLNDRAELPQTRGTHIQSATSLGTLSGDTQISSMALLLKPSADQDAALTKLLADQQNPTSPLFHKWLTPEEFGQRFGLSESDLQVLQNWLTAQGFQVNSIAPSRNMITFSGTAAAVENAFSVTLKRYQRGQKQFFENTENVQIPAALTSVVSGVKGLSSYRLEPQMRRTLKDASPETRSDSGLTATPNYTPSTGSSHYLVPWDFRQIYGMNSLINGGFNGTGIKIAVIGQSAVDLNQISYFQTLTGQTQKAPTLVLVPGTGASQAYSGDEGESEVDLEYASGSAPGANIYFVYTGNGNSSGVFDALAYSIVNNIAPVVTLSYGGCEADNVLLGGLALEPYFRQANVQGQTVLASSGDTGAAACDATRVGSVSTATQGRTVSYPASSPYVTGVGGTRFNEGAGSYWSSSNNAQLGSALGYIPEVVWNDTTTGGDFSATGGGASQVFGKPSWQAGTGVPADGARDVPDVAFASSSAHDAYLFCSAESTDEKCTTTTFGKYVIGGTSLAAPNFAAMLAVVQQKIGSTGFGDLNPALYSIFNGASGSTVFHDVTSGNNNVACQSGTVDCLTGTTFGYSANAGYDLTTGLGSMDASAFATAMAALTTSVPATPTIELTTTPYQALTNQSLKFTTQVTGKSSSPTGTVTFTIDGGTPSSAITLTADSVVNNNSVASYTVGAGLAAGSHTVVANYSGDANFAAASASYTFIVANPLTGAFSVSATPSTLTIASGSSGAETVNVTTSGGFADTINLTLQVRNNYTIPDGITVCYDFVAKPMTANSTATVSIPIHTSASACANASSRRILSPAKGVSQTHEKIRAGMVVLAFLLLGGIGVRGSKKLRGLVLMIAIGVTAIASTGCGSGGTRTTTTTIPLQVYAFSSRNLTVTATANFNLVIQ